MKKSNPSKVKKTKLGAVKGPKFPATPPYLKFIKGQSHNNVFKQNFNIHDQNMRVPKKKVA